MYVQASAIGSTATRLKTSHGMTTGAIDTREGRDAHATRHAMDFRKFGHASAVPIDLLR
jgi:hypothetical protein